MNGHDGYVHFVISTGGLHTNNSIEMVERDYPILYIQQEILSDAIGSGKWDGAPSVRTIIAAIRDPVTMMYVGDGHYNPARGAAGGADGVRTEAFLCKVKNGTETERVEELPTIHEVTIQPGEALDGIYCSGGGYGDPLERDPEMVRHRVREDWISLDKAREVYGVVLDIESELFTVDWKATEESEKS